MSSMPVKIRKYFVTCRVVFALIKHAPIGGKAREFRVSDSITFKDGWVLLFVITAFQRVTPIKGKNGVHLYWKGSDFLRKMNSFL